MSATYYQDLPKSYASLMEPGAIKQHAFLVIVVSFRLQMLSFTNRMVHCLEPMQVLNVSTGTP
ncbi:hypothetical protein DPMN_041703 [Dreissena polymorpha]|uniref:Uncharacterized protein n=1 Tax=Dreissena polymorpha TaxID=45954 RepID=A0A9D4CYB0_DREPO|nr:hypothetical protein DPMN_041703 [Dreissena polymorpha]